MSYTKLYHKLESSLIFKMQMTAETISQLINHIFNRAEYNNVIRDMLWNQNRLHLFDDCKQEIMLVIAEYKDHEKLIKLFNQNQFLFWYLNLCKNTIKSKNSPLFYKYIKPCLNMSEAPEDFFTEEELGSMDYEMAVRHLKLVIEEMKTKSRKHKNAGEIFCLKFFERMTIEQISKKIKISNRTVCSSLALTKDYLNEHFKLNNYTNDNSSNFDY